MNSDRSTSQWMERLREGDQETAQRLWERYFDRLVALADRRLPRDIRREFDEEDVALSALHSLFRGIARGRYPELRDHEDLWSLLVVITSRKTLRHLRRRSATKRGGDRVRGESIWSDLSRAGISEVIGEEPTPDFATEVAEESEQLLDSLDDESLRALALAKMEGLTNAEISKRLGVAQRTVERRLQLIRRLWIHRAEQRG
jgi:RNA polymerase sigma factor (sigma-70 family)